TMIELLVVITLIALLVALLLPALAKARDVSRTVNCQANVKQMGYLQLMYGEDNRSYFTPTVSSPASPPSMGWWTLPSGPLYWQQLIGDTYLDFKNPFTLKTQPTIWNCPSGPNTRYSVGSDTPNLGCYGLNIALGGTVAPIGNTIRSTAVRDPANVLMLT